MTTLLVAGGTYSYVHTPIEAFPDVTNTQMIIVSLLPGRSAEEVERFVSTPIEVAMNSVRMKSNMRSISMFGLSVLKINFEDNVEDFFARQQVNNLLSGVNLPVGCDSHVQPPYGPTDEIFRYMVQSRAGINAALAVKIFGNDLKELDGKANEVMKVLGGVRGVKDLVILRNLGQPEMSVRLDQTRMAAYGVQTADAQTVVEMAVGGKAATQIYEGERKFDVTVR